MAEGLLRNAASDLVETQSAGSKPAGFVHLLAIKVMDEIGINTSGHRSKRASEFFEREIATVITVCGNAHDGCPVFPDNAVRHRWGFSDPAHAQGTERNIVGESRSVRYEMKRVFAAYAAGLRDGRQLV